MKRQRKRFLDYCPYPRAPAHQVLRQYSKPLLSLAVVAVITLSLIAAISFMRPTLVPASIITSTPSPTPSTGTITPSIQPPNTPSNSPSPTEPPNYIPTPSLSPTPSWPTTNADNQSITYACYSSEALDNNGNPHVSYYDTLSSNLKYAWWNGTCWFVQTVDLITVPKGTSGSFGVGFYSSLALDSKGYPHISYYNYTNLNGYHETNNSKFFGELKYAAWNGVTWNIQTVDTGQVGDYCSIALDSNDRPHISYHAVNNHDNKYDGNLKYAHWTGASWDIQTIDSLDDVGYCTSIVLDSKDQPHISYLDGTNGNLKYASLTNGEWSRQVVDHYSSYTFSGACHLAQPATALVLDSSGNPHIGYISERPNGEPGQDLKYTHWDGTNWNTIVVDTGNSTGNQYCSLVLDKHNYPHFAYTGQNSLYQMVNSYTFWNGTSWNTITFERHYDPTNGGCITLDSADRPHIIATDSVLTYYIFEGT